jgi:hypothetical protein
VHKIKTNHRAGPVILTPLRFLRHFNDNDSGFIASRVLNFNMEITVRFSSQIDSATSGSIPSLFSRGAQTALNNR